jgi:hypothetical protein
LYQRPEIVLLLLQEAEEDGRKTVVVAEVVAAEEEVVDGVHFYKLFRCVADAKNHNYVNCMIVEMTTTNFISSKNLLLPLRFCT